MKRCDGMLWVRTVRGVAELVDQSGHRALVPKGELCEANWKPMDLPIADTTKPITIEMVQQLRLRRVTDLMKPERKLRAPRVAKPKVVKATARRPRVRVTTVDPATVTAKLAGMSPEQAEAIRKAFGL